MVKPKLLIVGDSFSADNTSDSWVTQLDYDVTNMSSRGSSEYRILQKLEVADISFYQKILVVHTSANRIYVESNPLHKHSKQYQECDLIYNDVKNNPQTHYAQSVSWWFENCWNQTNANYMHSLLIKRAQQLTNSKGIHITFFDYSYEGVENLYSVRPGNLGDINHMNARGNQTVSNILKKYL